MRQIILYPGQDGFWIVECPSLPGCNSQGQTKDEAILNIKEAIDLYIESLEEDGIVVPSEKYEVMSLVV
jgi:predicted RNase H-like HicB family nuclease